MEKVKLVATTTFGLESITRRELEMLGYNNIEVENGKVSFIGCLRDVVITNLKLRTAERVLIELDKFEVLSFEELYNKTFEIEWEKWIPRDANFIINGKSVKSKIYSISDSQSIVEKAIVDRLDITYGMGWYPKSGDRYKIEVSILKDVASITLDTSGVGLHKRGYRENAGEAPIKETLAAGLILLSFWNKNRALIDPFCGSGTIPIEAAMVGRNIAPGLDRTFDSENWDIIKKEYWREEREKAFREIDFDTKLKILASDIDRKSINIAKENAYNLGLENDINFFVKDFKKLNINEEFAVVITNPPYGKRIGKNIDSLYNKLGKKLKSKKTWSSYIITSNQRLEKNFKKKADRRRKLYNGRIEVTYFQYYGPKPDKIKKIV